MQNCQLWQKKEKKKKGEKRKKEDPCENKREAQTSKDDFYRAGRHQPVVLMRLRTSRSRLELLHGQAVQAGILTVAWIVKQWYTSRSNRSRPSKSVADCARLLSINWAVPQPSGVWLAATPVRTKPRNTSYRNVPSLKDCNPPRLHHGPNSETHPAPMFHPSKIVTCFVSTTEQTAKHVLKQCPIFQGV